MSKKSDVVERVEHWIGKSAKWTAYTGADHPLEQDTANTDTVFSTTSMCCWEMPMLAAKTLGHLDRGQIATIYEGVDRGALKKMDPLVRSRSNYLGRIYGKNYPAKGDLVFFVSEGQGELAHVGIALGEQVGGETLMMSFWSAAPRLAAMEWFGQYGGRMPTEKGGAAYKQLTEDYTEVDARIVKTTLEVMSQSMEVICQEKPTIVTGEPVWA